MVGIDRLAVDVFGRSEGEVRRIGLAPLTDLGDGLFHVAGCPDAAAFTFGIGPDQAREPVLANEDPALVERIVFGIVVRDLVVPFHYVHGDTGHLVLPDIIDGAETGILQAPFGGPVPGYCRANEPLPEIEEAPVNGVEAVHLAHPVRGPHLGGGAVGRCALHGPYAPLRLSVGGQDEIARGRPAHGRRVVLAGRPLIGIAASGRDVKEVGASEPQIGTLDSVDTVRNRVHVVGGLERPAVREGRLAGFEDRDGARVDPWIARLTGSGDGVRAAAVARQENGCDGGQRQDEDHTPGCSAGGFGHVNCSLVQVPRGSACCAGAGILVVGRHMPSGHGQGRHILPTQ